MLGDPTASVLGGGLFQCWGGGFVPYWLWLGHFSAPLGPCTHFSCMGLQLPSQCCIPVVMLMDVEHPLRGWVGVGRGGGGVHVLPPRCSQSSSAAFGTAQGW